MNKKIIKIMEKVKATKEDFYSYVEKRLKENGKIIIYKRPVQENINSDVEYTKETYYDLDSIKKEIEKDFIHELIVM